jgi:polar amino acid transport system substrate-binding protein
MRARSIEGVLHRSARRAMLVALLALAIPAAADTLTIRADEWYPINAEPGSERPGFMIELAGALLAPHDDTVDYRLLPWDEALAKARAGEVDCVVGALESETEGLLRPRRAWVQSEQVLYAAIARTITYAGPATLPGLRVAVIDGYSYGDQMDAYIASNRDKRDRVLLIDDSPRAQRELMMRLLVGHADVILESSVVMDAAIRRQEMGARIRNIGPVDPDAPPERLHIACTAGVERVEGFMRKFDEGFPKLEADGTLDRLRERYGIQGD